MDKIVEEILQNSFLTDDEKHEQLLDIYHNLLDSGDWDDRLFAHGPLSDILDR